MEKRKILIYLAIICNGQWDEIYDTLHSKDYEVNFDEINRVVDSLDCKVITLLDQDYPEQLKTVHKPPTVLFYYGDLSLIQNYSKCVSIIGSREHSKYGEKSTRNLVKDICKSRIIVSGLAIGIDSISHEETINNGGKTVAVLGCGFNKYYLKSNKELFEYIKKNHLIISEYPPDCDAKPEYFPMRNRLIAGMSPNLIVTEASKHSGSLITVFWALESGRTVFAVPYRNYENSGCNLLIKEGAILIENSEDFFNNC